MMERQESVDNNGSIISDCFRYYYHKGDTVPTQAIADMPIEHQRPGYLVHGRGTRKVVQSVNSLRGQLNNKLTHVESVRKDLERLEHELAEIKSRLGEEERMRPPSPEEDSPVREGKGISEDKLQAMIDAAEVKDKEKTESPSRIAVGAVEAPHRIVARGANIGKQTRRGFAFSYKGVLYRVPDPESSSFCSWTAQS